MQAITLVIMFVISIITCPAFAGDDVGKMKTGAVAAAEEIIQMRSTLAQEFIKPDMEITEETFKNVCGAVGKRVKEIMENDGYKIRHASAKNRNPANAAAPDEVNILETFDHNREIKGQWDIVDTDGKKFQRYMKPIFVEDACLACHGPKDKRPQFIVDKYPNDSAYDFKTGDLRGMVEVMFRDDSGQD
ncbi:MAG: DUF3365 domain-containing protein [Nitrospirae bacterium]|nr:DUF3365 domain-containing protein [Nitrospirota bacterium]